MEIQAKKSIVADLGGAGDMASVEPSAENLVAQLGEEAKERREAAGGVFKNIWWDNDLPGSITELTTRIREASNRQAMRVGGTRRG